MATIQALGSVAKVRGALIFVEDIESELAFYRDVIGLRFLYRTPRFVRLDARRERARSSTSAASISQTCGRFRL